MHWLLSVPVEEAVHEIGLFGNQNTVASSQHPKMARDSGAAKERVPDFNQ
jgi:hypothetical protein